ncbi:Arylalkylamine N-acetyltransferase [Hyphodiscus hymeniophilus]|uniref:Arylalkylamine N-acetyltransferase n=1 Tax=Hyphodiscus hymeniophilus TaxID=353542 RepID=A0A9P6VKU2_9HELO|nr:Arylalkylamine N-acetyltransferase [Hyphodiscus hymeniophilus]
MPRDLDPEKSAPVALTESPGKVPSSPDPSKPKDKDSSPQPQKEFIIIPHDQQYSDPTNLHPYTRPLTISDLDSVVALENASFEDPSERATREKFIYRLNKCNELCLGIFCTVVPDSGITAETIPTGHPVETSRPNGAICVLIGHVVAAKTNDLSATDKSMDFPKDWDSEHPSKSDLGHQEAGRTIVLHSVAVLPQFQGRGLGRVLLQAYIQQMNGAGIADRLVLIAHDHKVGWYERFGFQNRGRSKAQFGGGEWYDMVYELKSLEPRATYG